MENVVIQQIVLSSVHRTLHAQHFARASSQASMVLADLVSRYLVLLTSTCAQYAEHAGRTGITTFDAFAALEEIGVPVHELAQYGATEGNEFSRAFTTKTQRRAEELLELKAYLADGLSKDRSDALKLRYMRQTNTDAQSESDESDTEPEPEKPAYEPPSPISNPSVGEERPTRKRARSSDIEDERPLTDKRPRLDDGADRPAAIPAHLPPFPKPNQPDQPSAQPSTSMEVVASSSGLVSSSATAAPPPTGSPSRPAAAAVSAAAAAAIAASAASSSADYRASISYEQSSLASQPDWHLPEAPPVLPPLTRHHISISNPTGTQPATEALTHMEFMRTALRMKRTFREARYDPTIAQQLGLNPTNTPARHKVTMALLNMTTTPDDVGEDTLYGHAGQPALPRQSAQPPSHARSTVPLGGRIQHPPVVSRPSLPAPAVGKSTTILPLLTRASASSGVYERVSHLQPPGVQIRPNGHPAVYGTSQPALWNPPDDPALIPEREKERPTEPALTPAEMLATWPVEEHDYRSTIKRRR
ncbi:hypothetical protein BKA62DRAFT_747475 [Auriculariales sp. MPI-PUGE-AT-0066]|nr:hypothetical protein BKA62DRAFT_747475 [Auriculariales sp. MPI-PUGE-AT-0066]